MQIKFTVFLLDSLSQLATFAFQSQVCLSMSKARPAGHRTAASRMVPAKPARSHRTTSLQSPSVVRRKYSSDSLSLHNSSGDKLRRSSSEICRL